MHTSTNFSIRNIDKKLMECKAFFKINCNYSPLRTQRIAERTFSGKIKKTEYSATSAFPAVKNVAE
jgi:hypothetical protein